MIKVIDVAYVRFSAPDLGAMKTFLEDFGLVVNAQQGDVLYARGSDPPPYLHVCEQGEAGFRGVAFEAASAGDLVAAARLEGASPIEKIEAPGGGQRVRFQDPDGFAVEVVHGRERLAPLAVRSAAPLNRGSDRQRLGDLQRVEAGQSFFFGHLLARHRNFSRNLVSAKDDTFPCLFLIRPSLPPALLDPRSCDPHVRIARVGESGQVSHHGMR